MPVSKQFSDSQLVLGWRVTRTFDPRYWLDPHVKPGVQRDEELFKVPARELATHTAIIAQSGSGKSFFLGRVIEEIMLMTRARCLILDPNADFRRVSEVEDAALWKDAQYDPVERRGRLPHESSREKFKSAWSKVSIRIRGGADTNSAKYESLRIWWPRLAIDFLAEDVDPMLRSDLYHCHSFVKALGRLLVLRSAATRKPINMIDEAERICSVARESKTDIEKKLRKEFSARVLQTHKSVGGPHRPGILMGYVSPRALKSLVDNFINAALTFSRYVSPEVQKFYFGKARQYQATGILQTNPTSELPHRHRLNRLEVIDLPSLDPSTRLLAINALLSFEWDLARNSWSDALEQSINEDKRVPTFIVVDEAHNLIPNHPRGKPEKALREQFRTLVAEGRKYGLFLLLVTQRPDKLDPLVLSECENKAIMKLGSASVVKLTQRMLGLDHLAPKMLEKCLDFEVGRVLMVGRWAPPESEVIYAAARRTAEGGRNLRADCWAVPFEPPSRPKSRTRKR